jgi:tRNA-Thr(GGU) m(6)t(6)A37 methyltransferase TsaA
MAAAESARGKPAYAVRPIGIVRSPFRVHEGTPRQPGTGVILDGEIRLRPGLQNALKDLSGFSHVWVVFWFHHSRGWNSQVVPPRDVKKRGLFATRSPHRPNAIGISVVRLLQVQGLTLRIRGLDMLDGTPVLDVKPYVPYADAIPGATSGWLDELPADPGPDHRMPPPGRRPARSRR